MSRRLATIALHWSVLTLLMLLLASGSTNPIFAWSFGLEGLVMVAIAVVGGLMNGPGPILNGKLRRAHPWLNRGMYALLAWASLSVLASQLGSSLPGPESRTVLLLLLAAGLLHGIFNLWRITALNDFVLRRMLP